MSEVDSLLENAIDMHVHVAPDIMSMRLDALDAAHQAKNVKIKAIVLKNHHFPTTPIAKIISNIIEGIDVFGGICLDNEIGGLNPHALKASAVLGAKVVWMPTKSAANGNKAIPSNNQKSDGGYILDKQENLKPEIFEILTIVKKYNLVLCSGKLSPKEIFSLFNEAKRLGIDKLLINHAGNTDIMKEALTIDQQKQLTMMGALIEHSATNIKGCDFNQDTAVIVKMIKAVGVHNCILSSDMGLSHGNPNGKFPVDGLRFFIQSLLINGLTSNEIETMIKINPARLLNFN